MNAIPEYPRNYVISSVDYHRMGDAGIFAPDVRVELIEGEIIEMSPIYPPYAGTVNLLKERLMEAFAGQAIIQQVRNPIGLGRHADPQPDFRVLRFREDRYRGRAPESEDVLPRNQTLGVDVYMS
jgi:hypothetical protein